MRFDGKVVIVTGAGSGIGAATARRFGQEGARVIVAGRRPHKLVDVAAAIGDRAFAIETDVSDPAAIDAMIAACLEKFGRLDVLVNNAGVAVMGPFLDATLDDYRRVLAVNIDGVVFGCRAALPHLLETRGCIVNVSSVSGLGGDWGLAIYNTSKGAISNLTRALALEFGGRGVRVNAVNPSLTMTEMTDGMKDNTALMAKFADRIPLGRGARPEEVASVTAFLASEDAAFVNGVNLPVDGGLGASNGQPRIL